MEVSSKNSIPALNLTTDTHLLLFIAFHFHWVSVFLFFYQSFAFLVLEMSDLGRNKTNG